MIGGKKRNNVRLKLSKWRTSPLWTLFATGLMLGMSVLLMQLIMADWQAKQMDAVASVAPNPNAGENAEAPPVAVAGEGQRDRGSVLPNGSKPLNTAAVSGTDNNRNPRDGAGGELDDVIVRVYVTEEKRVESVPLETYVRGVVAGEMPADFELEALKAQAIAARTYIVRRLERQDRSGVPVEGADVTDTTAHQVYVPLNKLEGTDNGSQTLALLNQAIDETKGQIVAYEGEPIEAVFFSTSNGYTENSEDYWQEEIPYLRSVASPWDKELSPNYKETVTLKLSDFYSKLGITRKPNWKNPSIKVLGWTDGNRIAEVRIAGHTFTGREVREKLGLPSSQLSWKIRGDSIAITTYGYGHGIGMSQWGANGLAKEGRSASYILTYYYTGTEVIQASKLAARLQ